MGPYVFRFTLISCAITLAAWAQPVITGIDAPAGIGDRKPLAIRGSGLGSKPNPRPLLFADLEGGSLAPNASLGMATAFTQTQHARVTSLDLDGSDSRHSGTFAAGSVAAWRTDIHNLRYNIPDGSQPSYGGQLIIALWRRITYTYEPGGDFNLKWLRIYKINPGDCTEKYPNWYLSNTPDPAAAGAFWFVETAGGSGSLCPISCSGITGKYRAGPLPTNQWKLEEYLLKFPSGEGNSDGMVQLIQDGVVYDTFTSWKVDCNIRPGVPSKDINWQDDPSNYDVASGDVFKDDLYLDNTWFRVYLTNSASYLSATHRELQPSSAWTNNEVTITLNTGSFNIVHENVYVMVVDNLNRYSTGFRLFNPADFDRDRDVDQDDFGYLQACYNPAAPATLACSRADLVNNGRVDQGDLVQFFSCVSGPAIVANPGCGTP